MNNFKLKLFVLYSFFLFLVSKFSKSLILIGLKKLNLNDIQALTNSDIFLVILIKLKLII